MAIKGEKMAYCDWCSTTAPFVDRVLQVGDSCHVSIQTSCQNMVADVPQDL